MLACARIGAVHSIVFGGFSADALADRIVDATCTTVLTCDGIYRGAKPVVMKPLVDEAMITAEKEMGQPVSTCIVVQHHSENDAFECPMKEGRDFDYSTLMLKHLTNANLKKWIQRSIIRSTPPVQLEA